DNCDGQIDEDQGSSPAQVIINSQAELDALPAYTIINGNLNIIGTDVSDLSPLSCLVEIKNGLHIYGNTNLTTLSGLESLVKVKGITIRDNPNLVNTDALNFLSEVGTDGVEFKNNNALTHISLSGLTSIQYSATDLCIDISENDQLTTIS